jgi:PhnB protein
MATKLNPYLNFRGTTRAAMTFYHGVFGGDLRMSTFEEYHAAQDPSEANQIMHAQLDGPNDLTLMASDVPQRMDFQAGTNDFSVSLSGEDEAELTGFFNGLAQGGMVLQPLEKAPWGDWFGMLKDRFGVTWLVNITAPKG